MNKRRGEHASGFSAVHSNAVGRLITEKRAINATRFVDRSSKFRALAKDMPNIFIGHTRHATSGTPSRGRNNHPFNSDVYSMVHNGGVDSWRNVVKTRDLKMRSETDSEVILRLLERKENFYTGISHAMEIIPRTSRVAVALIRHNNDPRLFLFRNLYNPIHIMTYPRLHSIFFSSEGIHLEMALKSVFGDKTDKIMQEHEINIEKVPEWKSLEFNLVDGILPELIEELDVHAPKMGFGGNTGVNRGSSSYDSSGSYLPVVRGPSGTIEIGPKPGSSFANKKIEDWTTGELIKKVSDDTRDRSVLLTRSVREASKVLESIRSNSFMQHTEIEHWKKWMYDV